MTEPTVLHYTFGNHMHWVDMTWLWGEHVLPGSVRDTLRVCRETGARGNVNFDAVGYRKLAAEQPEAFAELRAAVQSGEVELVGGSYGQPYGLFHGGESNARQRIYGARTIRRLFGVPLRTFWEEEFDFFPQLPQLLAGVGVSHASLFFQWTWHTPHLPEEDAPAVWWRGLDGSRLLTAPRGPLNLHQWPEDFARLLDSDLPARLTCPGVVQWLELMPSPDWMCRAELMIPPLRELLARDDYDVRLVTLREYLEVARPHAVERSYGLGEVFHGVSLGKNGDLFRRTSRRAEERLLAAEAAATVAGFMGRPYPRWDVYPTWELEEAWRELLVAQHHDNDECEGLCGHIGWLSYERSLALSGGVLEHTLSRLAERSAGPPGRLLVFNPLGWERAAVVEAPDGTPLRLAALPPFGYRVLEPDAFERHRHHDEAELIEEAERFVLRRGAFAVAVDRRRGVIEQIRSAARPGGVLAAAVGDLTMRRGGRDERFERVRTEAGRDVRGPFVRVARGGVVGSVTLEVRLAPLRDAVDLRYRSDALPRPDAGVAGALATRYPVPDGATLLHDHPYGVSGIRPGGSYRRKYPTGDWMTSEQWFETVEAPFTALSLLDIGGADGADGGLLVLHDGSQALALEGNAVRQILSLYDPWDEDYFVARLDARVRLLPHQGLRHAERWRLAQEFTREVVAVAARSAGGELPGAFGPLRLHGAPGVAATALHRESEDTGSDLDGYAGRGLGYPLVLRLVEFDGAPAAVTLELAGRVAAAWRTNLLGDAVERFEPVVTPEGSRLRLTLRPHEIATIYLDVVEARKVARDLDARRVVWAQVHREGAVVAREGETGG